MNQVIPKKIHYCWFGGNPLPELAQKCIASWKKYCPDYDIIEWNETNYDFKKNKYMYEAYLEKKWGFVPDYARLDIIYTHGGIYLDTDVELLKPLDDLLHHQAFMGVEAPGKVALGLGFGSIKENSLIGELRAQYNDMTFYNPDGTINLTPAPIYQTNYLKKYDLKQENVLQELLEGVMVYPTKFFNPCDLKTGVLHIETETFSIHHYQGSWTTKTNKRNVKFYQFLHRYFGEKTAKRIRRIKKKLLG